MRRLSTTRHLVLASTLATLPLSAAEREAPLVKQGIKSAVQVTAMDLDVVATRDGQAVPDLTKEEITVKVDGKPFPLDYFARIDAGTVFGPDLSTASPDLVLETLADDKGDRYLSRQFLVFFDDDHLLPFERSRIIESLRDLVTRLAPSDRVSLLAYGRGKRILVPYTGSKETLLDGLARIEKAAPAGVFWDTQYRQDVRDARRSRATTRDSIIRNYAQQTLQRERSTLDDLRRAVSALAARSGKRALLLVSNGLELHPGQTFYQALGPGSGLGQYDYDVTPEYRAVIAEANRAGVTIHAIDAKGLTAEGDASESQPSAFSSFFESQNLREALQGLAQETGGILFSSRNDFKTAVDRVYRESSSYYSVGVTLANLDPRKKEHKVEVTTSRPGVTLRNRRTYSPLSADDAARDRMEMALLTPDAPGDFAARLEVGAPKKGGGLGRRLVPFAVSVPLASLTFLDDANGKSSTVEVSIAAIEDTGARSGIVPDRKTIRVPADAVARIASEPFRYTGEMKTGTGNFRFVATVRDVGSDRIAVSSASVRID